MTSSNPALRPEAFTSVSAPAGAPAMTVSGAVQKCTILLGFCVLSAAFTWKLAQTASGGGLMMLGALTGFIAGLVLCFKRSWAPVLAPAYAVGQGLFLGGISAAMNAAYHGLVVQAVALTFGTLFALLAAYQMRLVRATQGFRMGIFAATGGIGLFYLVSMVLGLCHIPIPFMQGGGTFSIIFSVIVCVVAALNFVIDFDTIENGAQSGAPQYMEWYAAFGLLVTLIWLYLEILRLLAKLRQRD